MNEDLFFWFNSWAGVSPGFDGLWLFLARGLGWFLVIVLLGYLLVRRAAGRGLLLITAAPITAWLIGQILKKVFASPRPFLVLDHVTVLWQHGSYDAFPSGHAVFFAALATALYFFNRRWGGVYFLGALLIGLARVVIGIHWPFDVVAGWLIGFGLTLGLYFLINFWSRKKLFDISDYPMR